jgi:hypothetical protein
MKQQIKHITGGNQTKKKKEKQYKIAREKIPGLSYPTKRNERKTTPKETINCENLNKGEIPCDLKLTKR